MKDINKGERLKFLIVSKGYSFAEMARELNVSKSQVSRDINTYNIKDYRLIKYLQKLDTTLNEFNNMDISETGNITKRNYTPDRDNTFLRVIEAQSDMINILREELAEYKKDKKQSDGSQSGSQ